MGMPKFPPELGEWLPGKPFAEAPLPAWIRRGDNTGRGNNPISYMEGLDRAYKWAAENQRTSVYAASALAYIDALGLAKTEAKMMGLSPEEGERTQLIYVLSNLTYWKGPEAREAKEALKKKVAELA